MDRKKIIYLISGLFLILLILFTVRVFLGPRITLLSVTPLPNQENVSLLPEIKLVFNNEVKPEIIKFASQPLFEYKILALPDKKTIKIEITKFLEKDAVYKINLEKPVVFSWQFKTRITQAGSVPGWEEEFLKQEQIYKGQHPQEEIINKLKSSLPHKEDSFTVEYAAQTDQFFIYLHKSPIGEAQKEALSWFEKQGIKNPGLLNIVWFPTKGAIPLRGD